MRTDLKMIPGTRATVSSIGKTTKLKGWRETNRAYTLKNRPRRGSAIPTTRIVRQGSFHAESEAKEQNKMV